MGRCCFIVTTTVNVYSMAMVATTKAWCPPLALWVTIIIDQKYRG